MKLYYAKGACSFAVRIIIHEIGIPCSFESVDIKTKKTAGGDDFLTINPKGAVPALLLDDGNILTENTAIQQYLADTHHAYELLPAIGNFNRYRVIEWLSFVSSDLHKSCGPLFNPHLTTEIKETFFKNILKQKLQFTDSHLKNKQYLTGESFTLADGYLFIILSWMPHFNIQLADDYPSLANYFAKLKQRKSIVKALAEEGL